MVLAAQLYEQIAKEVGDAFTNRRELTGKGGTPIAHSLAVRFVRPTTGPQGLRSREASMLAAEPMPLADVDLPEYAAGLFEPKRYKVLYGGRGAARSWSVARALLIKAAETPLRVGCFREFQKSIKDSVHRLLTDQIDLLGLPGFEITDHEIRHENGSLFLFEGLRHNVTKIKSLEGIDIAWVEEAERVSKASWDVLIPTIRKAGSEIWVNFNPDLEDDPTFVRFVKHPPPNAWVLKVSSADNPWFPAELATERAYLYAVDPDAAAHVWGGECRRSSAAQLLHGKWIVEEFEPEPTWDGPYHGADFGFAQDPNTLVRCWIAPGTIAEEHRPADDRARGVQGRPGHRRHPRALEARGARVRAVRHPRRLRAPETISYLARHGFPQITGVEKWSGSVEDGIAHLRQYEKIVIHPRCTHAADEARHYSYKVDQRTGDILPEIVDKHNHVWDAVRYALAPLIRNPDTGMLDYYAQQAAALEARRKAATSEAQANGVT
jgi:phage terminase large subunit